MRLSLRSRSSISSCLHAPIRHGKDPVRMWTRVKLLFLPIPLLEEDKHRFFLSQQGEIRFRSGWNWLREKATRVGIETTFWARKVGHDKRNRESRFAGCSNTQLSYGSFKAIILSCRERTNVDKQGAVSRGYTILWRWCWRKKER